MTLRGAACLFLCFALPCFAQTAVTVPVTGDPAPGSPLQIAGKITFTDQVFGNSVVSSSTYELTARNVSGKGIVLMLVRFREVGPRGGGVLHNIQWDNFFRDDEIVPEENFVLDRSSGGFQTYCCINPFESGIAPIAEARVIYAEFANGSTYGERSEAAGIFTTRSVILEYLHQLDRAGGNEAFLRLLAQKLKSDEADGFIETLRSVQKKGGTEAARGQVRRELRNAARHLRAMQAAHGRG